MDKPVQLDDSAPNPAGEPSNRQPRRRRFDAPVPTEMTICVPLSGDFRKITRCLVHEALARFHGNKAAAARALGLHRKTLYRLLQNEADGAVETAELMNRTERADPLAESPSPTDHGA